MILRLELPAIPEVVAEVRFNGWLVEVGQPVTYGDVVCLLRVGSISLPKRGVTGRALLTRVRSRAGMAMRALPASFSIRVVASDDGVLRQHLVGAGDRVEAGALLGLASTEADEPVDANAAIHRFRLLAEVAGGGGADGVFA